MACLIRSRLLCALNVLMLSMLTEFSLFCSFDKLCIYRVGVHLGSSQLRRFENVCSFCCWYFVFVFVFSEWCVVHLHANDRNTNARASTNEIMLKSMRWSAWFSNRWMRRCVVQIKNRCSVQKNRGKSDASVLSHKKLLAFSGVYD